MSTEEEASGTVDNIPGEIKEEQMAEQPTAEQSEVEATPTEEPEVQNEEVPNQEQDQLHSENAEKVCSQPQSLRAFVVGGSGEVGKQLVKQLAFNSDIKQITLIVRQPIKFDDYIDNRTVQKIVDFEKLEEHKDAFAEHDVGYCTLGTTRGRAGVDGFKRVDHDYVVTVAKMAKELGCKQFHLCSSKGANEKSTILYPKVKGQVEREITEMNFDKCFIYRPGLLLTKRSERRWGELIFTGILKPITFFFPTLISVPTESIAKAMLAVTIQPDKYENKATIFENKDIHKLADENK